MAKKLDKASFSVIPPGGYYLPSDTSVTIPIKVKKKQTKAPSYEELPYTTLNDIAPRTEDGFYKVSQTPLGKKA